MSNVKEYTEKEYNDHGWGGFFVGMFFAVILGFFFSAAFGAYDNTYVELDLDREEIYIDYAKVWYPEFKDCAMDRLWDSKNGEAIVIFKNLRIIRDLFDCYMMIDCMDITQYIIELKHSLIAGPNIDIVLTILW